MQRNRSARRGSPWTLAARPRRPGTAPYRPRLEALEGREAPALFEVTTTADGGPGSLRQAVLDANANGEDDLILLPAGTYRLTIAGAGEDAGLTGDLDVLQDVVYVQGAGAAKTVVGQKRCQDPFRSEK